MFLPALLKKETTQNVTNMDSQRCNTASYGKETYGLSENLTGGGREG